MRVNSVGAKVGPGNMGRAAFSRVLRSGVGRGSRARASVMWGV